MKKGVFIGAITVSLTIGAILGGGAVWYSQLYLPEQKATQTSQKHQEELKKMYVKGEVVSVNPREVVITVLESATNKKGEKILAMVDAKTSFQKGIEIISRPGEIPPVEKHLKPGTKVDLLVNEGKAVAIYFD